MRKKRVIVVVALTAAAAALIVIGLLQIMGIYRHYREDMLKYESQHLTSIVSTSARGMDVLLEGYKSLAAQTAERRSSVQAEERVLETGQTGPLEALISREDLFPAQMSCVAAVYDREGNLIAVSAENFPADAARDETLGEGITLRRGGDGTFWFVFQYESERGFRYVLAVSVEKLFSEHAAFSRVGEHGYLFMMDREGSFFVFCSERKQGVYSLEELVASYPDVDADALAELCNTGADDSGGYTVLRYPWKALSGKSSGSEETLVTVCPLPGSTDRLVIGAALSFQEFDSFLSDMMRQVTWVSLLLIAGTLLLIIMLAWIMAINRRNAMELQVAREKAELMEEIGRQQQSLYHNERLQQLGLMTSGVIHEFNNLLTPIMSQTHLLLDQMADQEDSPLFESALDVLQAEENAREVLRRMTDIGKRHADMEFHTLELRELLRRTMDLSALVKKNEIRRELILPDVPLYVSGNDQLLTQAFLNLCINAVQAMGDTGTLAVRADTEERSGRTYARITVSDTGPGIPEEMFASIYEPFFTTKGAQGTGLGLAICRKIIESHKGTITAANRPEGGAVFTVRIPTCPPPSEAGA